MSIGSASDSLRARLDKEGDSRQLTLDALYDTVKDLKSSREKREKAQFEYQKESMALKATARNAGFDIDYDPDTNTITPTNLPPPEPSRLRATRTPDGGMQTEETVGTPPRPGEAPAKPTADPGTDAVLAGFKAEQILKAKERVNGPGGANKKPLTQFQTTTISFNKKISRLIDGFKNEKGEQESGVIGLIDTGVNRVVANNPRFMTTAQKGVEKALTGKVSKKLANSERFRDILQQLEASIPFAKGGRTLSPTEYAILHRLLQFGIETSDETIKFNMKEFQREYRQIGELALKSQADITEDDLSNMAGQDVSSLSAGNATGSTDDTLQRLLQEEGLE